jgi:hypothetical protein
MLCFHIIIQKILLKIFLSFVHFDIINRIFKNFSWIFLGLGFGVGDSGWLKMVSKVQLFNGGHRGDRAVVMDGLLCHIVLGLCGYMAMLLIMHVRASSSPFSHYKYECHECYGCYESYGHYVYYEFSIYECQNIGTLQSGFKNWQMQL